MKYLLIFLSKIVAFIFLIVLLKASVLKRNQLLIQFLIFLIFFKNRFGKKTKMTTTYRKNSSLLF